MANSFYVLGGTQQPGKITNEWTQYERALILRVEPENKSAQRVVDYKTPPEFRAEPGESSVLFKAGWKAGDQLYTCTSTEVLIYALPSFKQLRHVSHPYFNDLHHVRPTPDGNLVVVSTGLDLVLVMSPEGQILKEYPALEEDLWSRFSRTVDYRKVLTTKPHHSHPNYAFFLGEELWVTRLDQRDAVRLPDRQKQMRIAVNYPHDGVVYRGQVYFTTVDGHLVLFDAGSLAHVRTIDLNQICGTRGPLGWCRGIHVLNEDIVVVGFTRLKPTKWKEKVMWAKSMLGGERLRQPTRVVALDIRREQLLWEFDLEPFGLNVLFSIHEA